MTHLKIDCVVIIINLAAGYFDCKRSFEKSIFNLNLINKLIQVGRNKIVGHVFCVYDDFEIS